ncbi:circularly permuted type 2 ATP-grasp protein [Radiobacillus sp. PE A8.2]|uniref:circularly permuted type 2 ATP-grasp protein n=1 Tax=Radiobacillus sp. PE A8.2 TaxID=3380349 RepID=UPI00388EBFDE
MFDTYELEGFFDEMFEDLKHPHTHCQSFYEKLTSLKVADLKARHDLAQQDFLRQGITFTVYSDNQGTERTMPFDFVPKIIPSKDWDDLEKGLKQRFEALNAFLDDVYHDQQILKDGIIPRDLIVNCPHFLHQVSGIDVPRKQHIFIAGIDLIRDKDGEYRVLEDNLRNPSGLSYVFQNRYVMRKVYPEFFFDYSVRSLEQQFSHLHGAMASLAPPQSKNPTIVLLTPGIFNSAYYDHSFLAQQTGIELVEGRDLVVKNRHVYMKTTRGLQKVDVLYRRIDDEFLDPLEFREDSLLGVPGLIDVYRSGNVSILNGIGNGVADDKAVYHYVPDMIRYYLNEEPLIKNVETYLLRDPKQLAYVLDHLSELVVKQTNASGGYNMLIGPHATKQEIEAYRKQIVANPADYIAQPTMKLSRLATFKGEQFAPCHVDLRVYIFGGEDTHVFPGGLSRVALKEGSLVVNSSQGGGAKDTWVLENIQSQD